MLALTLSTCGGRSVGIVCLRTKATEFRLMSSVHRPVNTRCTALRLPDGTELVDLIS
jgi:hypothetical protein